MPSWAAKRLRSTFPLPATSREEPTLARIESTDLPKSVLALFDILLSACVVPTAGWSAISCLSEQGWRSTRVCGRVALDATDYPAGSASKHW